MRKFRTWVTVSFFWLPLVVVLFLNPGRNGSNVAQLSLGALWLLTACGLMLGAYGLAGFFQPRAFGFAFSSAQMATLRLLGMVFALLLGAIAVYQGCQGLASISHD